MIPAVDGVCAECGYDYDECDRAGLPGSIKEAAAPFAHRLRDSELATLRAHPKSGVWSALEYACHLRDVFGVQLERVQRALTEVEPGFASMRREERVTEERYNEQHPEQVARQVVSAAEALASQLAALDEAGWSRTGVYSYPSPRVRTVEWIARHTLHEAVHHLLDVDRLITRPAP